MFCHAYDQVEIAAGAGTIAEELLDDDPDIEVIVVAVGGGGLFAGVAVAAAGRADVVAVEPATIPTLHAALAQGAPVDVGVSGVAADALGARRIGGIAFDVAQRFPPRSVLVSDDEIVAARAELWQRYRIAAEHGAATAYAAVHAEQITDLIRDEDRCDRLRRQHRPPHPRDRVTDSPAAQPNWEVVAPRPAVAPRCRRRVGYRSQSGLDPRASAMSTAISRGLSAPSLMTTSPTPRSVMSR